MYFSCYVYYLFIYKVSKVQKSKNRFVRADVLFAELASDFAGELVVGGGPFREPPTVMQSTVSRGNHSAEAIITGAEEGRKTHRPDKLIAYRPPCLHQLDRYQVCLTENVFTPHLEWNYEGQIRARASCRVHAVMHAGEMHQHEDSVHTFATATHEHLGLPTELNLSF